MTNQRKIRTSVENHSAHRDCNGLKLHTNGVAASHELVRESQDSREAFETEEFEAWMDGQIAEQRAFEARIDMMIK